jgi:hypothetical protein
MLSNLTFPTEYLTDILVLALCIFLVGNFHVGVKPFDQNVFCIVKQTNPTYFHHGAQDLACAIENNYQPRLRLTYDQDNLTNVT